MNELPNGKSSSAKEKPADGAGASPQPDANTPPKTAEVDMPKTADGAPLSNSKN